MLRSFATEEEHGLIFVTLSNDVNAALLNEFLGAEVVEIAPWGIERSQLFIEGNFQVAANWKLVVDGAVDSLHAPYLHAETVGKLVVGRVAVFETLGRHGRLYQPRRKLLTLIEAGESPAGSSKYIASIMLIYPNSLLASAPDHVEFWTVWPSVESPGHCTASIRLFARSEILNPEMESRIRRSWDILIQAQTADDWPMERSIQRNAAAWPQDSFLFGRGEVSAQHLHLQLARDVQTAR